MKAAAPQAEGRHKRNGNKMTVRELVEEVEKRKGSVPLGIDTDIDTVRGILAQAVVNDAVKECRMHVGRFCRLAELGSHTTYRELEKVYAAALEKMQVVYRAWFNGYARES